MSTWTFPTPSRQVILSFRWVWSFHLSMQYSARPELGHGNSESSKKCLNLEMVWMELTWKANAPGSDSDLWLYIRKRSLLQEKVVWMKNESKTQNFIFTCSIFSFLMSYWYAEQISVKIGWSIYMYLAFLWE